MILIEKNNAHSQCNNAFRLSFIICNRSGFKGFRHTFCEEVLVHTTSVNIFKILNRFYNVNSPQNFAYWNSGIFI